MVVLGLTCVPIIIIWANTERILVFLGQDPLISAVAGEYARWLIPSLFAYVPLLCHIRFLQTQSIVLPVTASSGFTALCHLAVCWALVYKAGMGSKGPALSNAVSYGINLAILSVYVRVSSSCKGTWSGFVFVLHLHGMGLWLGIVCGSFTKLIFLIDWEKEALKAKNMVFSTSLPVA